MKNRNYAKLFMSAVIGIAPVAGLAMLAGCEGETVGVGVSDYDTSAAVVYQPGYYYDEGFYDTGHIWHPRQYYYYDGRSFAERNEVPHGYVARQRQVNREQNQRIEQLQKDQRQDNREDKAQEERIHQQQQQIDREHHDNDDRDRN